MIKYNEITDIELVNQVLEGNEPAFVELIKRYQKRVISTIKSIIGDVSQQDLEDITQDIFILIFKALKGFRAESLFSTYITTIAMRHCYKVSKNRRRKKFLFFSYDSIDQETDKNSIKESFAGDSLTDKSLILEENTNTVINALQKLPEEFRTVMVFRIVEEMSVEEVAKLLNISEGTVKSRLSRAKDKMKEILKNDSFEFYD